MQTKILILGKSCPSPGYIPNGKWSCTSQHLEGHSLFNTPTYKGKCRYYLSAWLSLCKGLSQRVGKGLRCQCLNEKYSSRKYFSAMQCWLECENGYVAQEPHIVTCVNGEYVKACYYFQEVKTIIFRCASISWFQIVSQSAIYSFPNIQGIK